VTRVYHRYYETLQDAEADYSRVLEALGGRWQRVVYLAPPLALCAKGAAASLRDETVDPEVRGLCGAVTLARH